MIPKVLVVPGEVLNEVGMLSANSNVKLMMAVPPMEIQGGENLPVKPGA